MLAPDTHDSWDNRRVIRYIAAFMAAITAAIYFMIGFNVVSVLDKPADQVFGLPAGIAYALGAALLIWFDRRIVWILGAVLQIFVIYTYFSLAGQRSPAFEFWGILLRITQAVVLVTLAYLAIRWPYARPSQRTAKHA